MMKPVNSCESIFIHDLSVSTVQRKNRTRALEGDAHDPQR